MYVVFDIETTGLDTMRHDIIQFAYAMFDDNNSLVKAEDLYFYYDGMHWDQELCDKIHHISLDFLKQHKDKFRENVIKMFSVMNRAKVCGHNAISFDCPFVRNWLTRQGVPGLEYGLMQDTMLAFRPVTKRSRIKLGKLADMLGYTQESIKYVSSLWFGTDDSVNAHNAAYDVAVTGLITMEGLRRNLIRFDLAVNLEPDKFTLADLVSEEDSGESKPTDPNSYVVILDEDGNHNYYSLNHDKSKYGEVVLSDGVIEHYKERHLLVPIPFKPKSDNVWTMEHEGTVWTLTIDEDGDYMSINNSYLTIIDTSISNIDSIIKNSF